MKFERAFAISSYLTVLCGFLSLWVSGTYGPLSTILFVGVIAVAWWLEGSRFQVSERIGTALIVLALPLFYLLYRLQPAMLYGSETAIAGILSRMILVLSAVKLLQRKGDRDWIFLYLMAFFEVLLAAGLSISPLYLASFVLYLALVLSTIITFEIRRSGKSVRKNVTQTPAAIQNSKSGNKPFSWKVPTAALVLLVMIGAIAIPLFFFLPRVGGAGFGGSQTGLSTYSGFSDKVRLGGIGKIQQSDEVVMRVKIDGDETLKLDGYFRGVVLDTFDDLSWSKSKGSTREPLVRQDNGAFSIDDANSRSAITKQTVYLEPLDGSVPTLFALPRVLAVKGSFPFLLRDPYGSIGFQRTFERVSYEIESDTSRPDPALLRNDNGPYGSAAAAYLQLPDDIDPRIFRLAADKTEGLANRYDKAVAIAKFLQNDLSYTLEQKASGPQPLSDFLFNVRAGHCEYFATAMAIMLRTQGIATRIVNGFHGGDYNDAAGVTIVKQRNAHSWVEVYFPGEDKWVTFDPTPFAVGTSGAFSGISGQINKYVEALETVWIQYFVAFDDQGQQSMTRTLRDSAVRYSATLSAYSTHAQAVLSDWWAEIRGDRGLAASLIAAGYLIGSCVGIFLAIFFLRWFVRRIERTSLWRRMRSRMPQTSNRHSIDFYDEMLALLSDKGSVKHRHQTPLEFALGTGIPEVHVITQKYNSARFGNLTISPDERKGIADLLDRLRKTSHRKATIPADVNHLDRQSN